MDGRVWLVMHLVCLVLFGPLTVLSKVKAKTGVLRIESGREWRCDFGLSSCGIMNQNYMPSNFTLIPDKELFGEKGLLYLDTSNCRMSGARLITPYFAWGSRVRRVCITIRFAYFGTALTRMLFYKQDKRNTLLWSQTKFPGTTQWQEACINAKIIPGYPARFFIEAGLNFLPNRQGFLALSYISLTDSICRR